MTDNLTHHQLTAEWVGDKHGPAVMLTQAEDGYSEPNSVLVHPWQLRAVCEHFGLLANNAQAAKTIGTLQRRMLALRDRIESLQEWMTQHSDHKHADLSYEMTRIDALADLAREWCADFSDDEQASNVAPICQPFEDAPAAQTCTQTAPAAQA